MKTGRSGRNGRFCGRKVVVPTGKVCFRVEKTHLSRFDSNFAVRLDLSHLHGFNLLAVDVNRADYDDGVPFFE